MIMEFVRGYVYGWYDDVVTERIRIEDGLLTLGDKPGLGIALHDDFASRPGSHVEVSTEQELTTRSKSHHRPAD